MDEEIQKTAEGKTEEKAKEEDSAKKVRMAEGSSEEGDMIDKANLAALRLEEANKKKEELLGREETLMAKRILGGTAEAGGQAPEKKEETPEEYTKKVMSGEV